MVNPLIETGFRWNFGPNENGQYILHNALEEWDLTPFPIEGIKYVKPDQLPVTFWDESDPVREDEQHPWPSEGTLAVFDGEGDILMYYSKHENAWWFAGYQEELPGNMVFRQSSMSLALTGVRYKPVDEDIWPGSDLNVTWQEIRNHVDWLAYTRRTGNYISFENFCSRVSNGEVFEYQSMLYDLTTREYKLATLSNKSKIYLQTTLVDIGLSNSYESSFHALYHSEAPGLAAGTILNPDNSISIVSRKLGDKIKGSVAVYIYSGVSPFYSEIIKWLAANDTAIKEGLKSFDNSFRDMITQDEGVDWYCRVNGLDPAEYWSLPWPEEDHILSIVTPMIYPNIENPHPRQKP